jgi:hypothetical protein
MIKTLGTLFDEMEDLANEVYALPMKKSEAKSKEYERRLREEFISAADLKKEIEKANTGTLVKSDYSSGWNNALNYINRMCNSSEQNNTDSKTMDSEGFVSGEHAGEESTNLSGSESDNEVGKSSPVHNPDDEAMMKLVERDFNRFAFDNGNKKLLDALGKSDNNAKYSSKEE